MRGLKTKKIVLSVALLWGILGPSASYGWQPKLDRVVYITLSQACSCTLERCQAGDIIVGNVFIGERKGS